MVLGLNIINFLYEMMVVIDDEGSSRLLPVKTARELQKMGTLANKV